MQKRKPSNIIPIPVTLLTSISYFLGKGNLREYKRGLDSLTVSLLFTRQSRGDENIAASAISSGGVFTSLTTQTVYRNKQLHNDNLNSL